MTTKATADRILAAKVTPAERTAFQQWLLMAAQAAADATKEGGFLGFGAEWVSDGEQRMLDQLAGVFEDQPG